MILVKKVLSDQYYVMRRGTGRSYYYCGDEPLQGGGVKRVWSASRSKALPFDHERKAHDTVERLRKNGVSLSNPIIGEDSVGTSYLYACAA